MPSIGKYDNKCKYTLQVTIDIDGAGFHGFFLITQQLTKWILPHRRDTIATDIMNNEIYIVNDESGNVYVISF